MTGRVRAALLVSSLLLASPTWAQEDPNLARGFSPGELYDYSGVDTVNLFNGNLVLSIPVGLRYPLGGGFSYGLVLSYNSTVWDFETVSVNTKHYAAAEPRETNAGLGWHLSLGGTLYHKNHPDSRERWRFVGEDGSEHGFYTSLHVAEPYEPGVHYSRDGSYLRLLLGAGANKEVEYPDGTVRVFEPDPTEQYRYRLREIHDRFGNWVRVDYVEVEIEEKVFLTWQITDSAGRYHQVVLDEVDGSGERLQVLRAELERFGGGGLAKWTLSYEPDGSRPPIRASCKDNEPLAPGVPFKQFDVPLLAAVTLPDGTAYEVGPYNNPADCENAEGELVEDLPGTLARLRLPTRGLVEWDYQAYQFPNRGVANQPESIIAGESAGVERRRMLAADATCWVGAVEKCTWHYDWAHLLAGGEFSRETAVTTPADDTTVNYFNQKWTIDQADWSGWGYGLPYRRGAAYRYQDLYLSQRIYDGERGQGGTLARSVYVGYAHDKLKPKSNTTYNTEWHDSNRRLIARRVHYEDDDDLGAPRYTEERMSDFDGVGHHRRRVAIGDLRDPSEPSLRTEHTHYNRDRNRYDVDPATNQVSGGYDPWPSWKAWVLGTYDETWAEEGTDRVEAQYCFQTATGFLQRRRTLAGTAPASHDLVSVFVRDVAGNPIREKHYGGEVQQISIGADLCTLSLPSTPTYWLQHQYTAGVLHRSEYLDANGSPLPFKAVERTVDAGTGLVASSIDPAGLRTNYLYDELGRLTWIRPQSGGDAWTQIVYQPASGNFQGARANVLRWRNGTQSGVALAQSRYTYDGFGRVVIDELRLPEPVGWSATKTLWGPQGRKIWVTERGPGAGKTEFKMHDPFGRPKRIDAPDYTMANGHFVELLYKGVRRVERKVSLATGAAGAESRQTVAVEEYDHQGRLWRVTEPSGPEGDDRSTVYDYDAGGRLAQVTQSEPATAVQTRSFDYDGRGFLLDETHPERGTTSYGLYDARGHAGRRDESPGSDFDLTFCYDRAERLTAVREGLGACTGPGAPRPLKEFVYGTSLSPANRSNHKIETAVRHNYVSHPDSGAPLDVTVEETYTYGGTGGRASRRDTVLNTGQSFTQGWTYDDLGQVTALDYPTCTHPADCTTQPWPRTVTRTYDRGFLTAVPGWASSITYHPNGMLDDVFHANGVLYYQHLDPDNMRRPAAIGANLPVCTSQLGGDEGLVYAYDGAGNVKLLGDEQYRYDAVSRVVYAELGNGDYQTYLYDTFGNLTEITTKPHDADPETREVGIEPQTNRLSASTYDAAGNLTDWIGPLGAGQRYDYDPFNMLSTRQATGADDTHIYTADDERIWTADNTAGTPWTDHVYLRDLDGRLLRTFYTDSGGADLAWQRDYVHRDGGLLASIGRDTTQASVETYHYHPDHLGSVRLRTDAQGCNAGLYSYWPFGENPYPQNENGERMRFAGHERDHNASGTSDDLDYMHARYCSPHLGRFLSVDPEAESIKLQKPQSWNRYAYVRGNPLRYVDPNGEDLWDVVGGFANAVGSNMLLGAGRREAPNDDFLYGQGLGDAASIATGFVEAAQGGSTVIAGTLCTAGTAGGCAPVGTPAMATGAVLVVHGTAVISTAATNLVENAAQMSRRGPGGSDSAGDIRVLSERQLEGLGIQPHEFKTDLLGKKLGKKYNIGVDADGHIVFVPVKKGSGNIIETGINIQDLTP